MLNTLHKIGLKYGTDKTYNGYTILYHMHFNTIRTNVSSILEIGIQNGNSLRMWEEYFPNSIIYGVDIDDKSYLNSDRIFTFKGDQTDTTFLNHLPNDIDIIIDDGGHTMIQQTTSLGCLFKKVKSGGIYIVEDLGTSIMPFELYGGNINNINTVLSSLEKFATTGVLLSDHLSESEILYIINNTKSINIYGDYSSQIGLENSSPLGGIAGIIYKK